MKLVRTFGRTKKSAAALIEAIERRGSLNTSKVAPIVRRILADVRQRGDAALRNYAARFDGLPPGAPLLVSRDEMRAAWKSTSPELQKAMKYAQGHIRAFAVMQRLKEWTVTPGPGRNFTVGQIVRPLESVGCYV